MKIHFYLRYTTSFGETLSLLISRDGHPDQQLPLQYLNQEFWRTSLDLPEAKPGGILRYQYALHTRTHLTKKEWENARQLDLNALKNTDVLTVDTWNAPSQYENAFETQPFRLFNATPPPPAPPVGGSFPSTPSTSKGGRVRVLPPTGGAGGGDGTHEFRVKAPLLRAGESLCLLGSGHGLHDWSRTQPVRMQRSGAWWVARVDLGHDDFPVAYKYGIWNDAENRFARYEDGDNRSIYFTPPVGSKGLVVVHDGFVRLPNTTFKGAGVAIPVFSLRSAQSGGVGEFTDLHGLADWAKSVGLKILQLLPINDTSATGTWTDSYPYASISAFALHPLYLNLAAVAGKKHAALLKPYAEQVAALNALEAVDYEAVLSWKWAAIEQLYAKMKADFLKDADYLAYFEANRAWLQPYAAFCCLKNKFGTTDFNAWPEHAAFDAAAVEKLTSSKSKDYDAVAVHYFTQWHLHLQLKAATDYAHAQGLAVKGDIPIGIYRYSCDAWVAPDLYNMDAQAGAPPDDFAEKGQNWGFPTYNWERMKADGFAWWRQRFAQMSLYFDAFRIDHILGFFRIWSIPLDAVEGILGRFVPAIPVREPEFWQAGVGFNYDRLCRPYVSERVLWETFGDDAVEVRDFLQKNSATGRYDFKPEFDSQRKVEAHFNTLPATEQNVLLRDGLFNLLSNVLLYDGGNGAYHFRFGMEKTSSYQHLPAEVQEPLKALYLNYFYRRQDEFWEREALEKLPDLKRATEMLICGEDLGMVPDCVPGVMRELGILSLEIQRMPKAPGNTFFHPKDAPYLSVVTPSTHDMSTIRGWWEEDRALTQRFWNEQLGGQGDAPWFCEPAVCRDILAQHFYSPAMWSIFQLQDLLSMDGVLRRENPEDERINVPANPKHYWRYRMHFTLENLQQAADFNAELRGLVQGSGRG